jgi:hypothetical protein
VTKFFQKFSLPNLIGGLILFVIGLALFGLFINLAVKDFPIWIFGQKVTGVVEEKGYELIEENAGELSFTYYVNYSFITNNGESLSGTSSLSALEWSALVEGDDIVIVYSPFNPDNNRIDDSRYLSLFLCSYVPFILIIWFLLKQGWNLLYREIKQPEPLPTLEVKQVKQE